MRHKLLISVLLFTTFLWCLITIIHKPLDPNLRARSIYGLWLDCGESQYEYYPYAYYRHFKVVRTYKSVILYQRGWFTLRRRIALPPQLILTQYGGRGYLRPKYNYLPCSHPQICIYYDYYEYGANGLHCHSTLDYT